VGEGEAWAGGLGVDRGLTVDMVGGVGQVGRLVLDVEGDGWAGGPRCGRGGLGADRGLTVDVVGGVRQGA
jgi:hypothetical protein